MFYSFILYPTDSDNLEVSVWNDNRPFLTDDPDELVHWTQFSKVSV